MNNYIITPIILIFLGCNSISETNWSFLPPTKNQWQEVKTYGGSEEDIANSIISTNDGGFALIGNTKSVDGHFSNKKRNGSDIFLMKFDSNLKLQWTKTYGGSEDDRGQDLVQLSDDGFVLVGYSKSSDGDSSENKGQHDNWLIRTDSSGLIIWEKSFGFSGHDHAYNIIETSNGGLFFNGFLDVSASQGLGRNKIKSNNFSRHGVGEFWVHKIDMNGNLQWRNYFGGSNNDRSYDAIETSQGEFVIMGSSESDDIDITNPKGSYDIWVVKIDGKGQLIWEKSIGGSEYDSGKAIIEAPNGDFLILGQTYSLDGDIKSAYGSSDIVVARLSSDGKLKDLRNIGTSSFEKANSFLRRKDGTLIIVGQRSNQNGFLNTESVGNDIALYYTLENGSIIKTNTLGDYGFNQANDVILSQQNKVIVIGSSESVLKPFQNSKGSKDIFLAIWY